MKIIVLAAGKSKRFKSSKHKALHELFGKSILDRVLETLWSLNPSQIQMVLGHQLQEIVNNLKNGETHTEQKEQLGTGHALQCGLADIEEYAEGLLVTCVDTPLLSSDTLKELIEATKKQKADIGILTTQLDNPFGYGRIVKNKNIVTKIVEEKDATEKEKEITEINSGVYFFNISTSKLKEGLSSIKNSNKQGEYYLTDIIEWANSQQLQIISYTTEDRDEIHGINSKADLSKAIEIINNKNIKKLQDEGVIFIKPETCLVSPETIIGTDTIIHPNTYLERTVQIGENCRIGPNCHIEDSTIRDATSIRFSQVVSAQIGNNCSVGPFANLRPGTIMKDDSSVGDFVEIKNSEISSQSRVPHLSYIGDAELGEEVNIGAGTITANFNAITGEKNKTEIGNNVKVGSNSVLVAPVKIADGCMVAAGSVVTENVTREDSLIISREKQKVKENWVKEKKSTLKQKG